MWRVLCVDDDATIAGQVSEYFTNWKKDNPWGEFDAAVETDFAKATKRLAAERFDLVTLDLHAETDPAPRLADEGYAVQQGKLVLDALKEMRFVPVIFYSGYAEKIGDLQSLVVRVVKKGENDLEQVRGAAKSLFATGLPKLVRHIDEEQRSYVWDTIDKHSAKFGAEGGAEELLYLVARRIAARLNRESLKELFSHEPDNARPIELYIYPPLPGKIKTGEIYGQDTDDVYWIVATPSCDFAQDKADRILLVGATKLASDSRFAEWQKSKWMPGGNPSSGKAGEAAYNKFRNLLTNNAGERIRFLPGTFFLPDLVVDVQLLRQVTATELAAMSPVCRLDSPYREELFLHLSKYYGRLGTPDLEITAILEKLKKS